MDLEALRTITLVAQQGSFAAAARVLDMDPSSVSRSVANTEAELGLRIFQRSTRALSLTEEGETYLRRIEPLIDEFEHARDIAQASCRRPSGTLKMTASVAFAHECIVPILSAFHERYPEMTVELLPTDMTMDIAANSIDLAIRLAPAPKGDLISTRLMTTRYRVCASPAYLEEHGPIVKPGDLIDHNCLRFALPDFRTRWRFKLNDNPAFDVPVSGHTIIANALSLRQAAVDGMGAVLLADWLIRSEIQTGSLVDVFPEYECTATEFDTAAWMLYPSRSYLPRKVRVMIDYLRERLG
ncbi:MAG: LysR family transcriptional regulator [Paracoccaceae bacterium]|nr:LysR family transcriptional regulator [Paracoccaceae bacterium]